MEGNPLAFCFWDGGRRAEKFRREFGEFLVREIIVFLHDGFRRVCGGGLYLVTAKVYESAELGEGIFGGALQAAKAALDGEVALEEVGIFGVGEQRGEGLVGEGTSGQQLVLVEGVALEEGFFVEGERADFGVLGGEIGLEGGEVQGG